MSSSTQISRIGVIGAGFMGSGIAESCAVAGVDVTAFEPEQAPLDRSAERLEAVDRPRGRAREDVPR